MGGQTPLYPYIEIRESPFQFPRKDSWTLAKLEWLLKLRPTCAFSRQRSASLRAAADARVVGRLKDSDSSSGEGK